MSNPTWEDLYMKEHGFHKTPQGSVPCQYGANIGRRPMIVAPTHNGQWEVYFNGRWETFGDLYDVVQLYKTLTRWMGEQLIERILGLSLSLVGLVLVLRFAIAGYWTTLLAGTVLTYFGYLILVDYPLRGDEKQGSTDSLADNAAKIVLAAIKPQLDEIKKRIKK